MNDHELDRLVATATHVRDGWVAAFDLRAADDELLEEIMATTDTPVPLGSGPPDESGSPPDEPSPFGRAPRPRRRFTPAVAVGVAAALVVGVVVLRSTARDPNGDGERGDVGTSGEEAIRPMIADPLPEGFEVFSVAPEEGADPAPPPDGPIDTWVYGQVTATAITDDVVISVETTEPDVPEGSIPIGEPVTVRGQQGLLCSPGLATHCDFGDNVTGVSWTEPSGPRLSVESRTFDRDQVLAIAEGLAVDGTTVELGDMPAGVTAPPLAAELHAAKADAYSVTYQPAGESSPGPVYVSTRAEDEARRVYDLWLSGPRDGTVQGRPAAVEDIDGAYVVTWSPAPGQLVEILANGLDEAAALRLAESVRPATDAEWAELQQQVASRPPEGDPGELRAGPPVHAPPEDAVHRELAGGAQVWGWLDAEGMLCYRTERDDGTGSGLCSPGDVVLGVSPSGVNGGPMEWREPAVVGVAPEGTASIEGGEATFGEQVEDGRLFVWEFSDGDMPDTLTFLDADGDEITTLEVTVI
jgi:hypothetical protein